MVSPIKETFKNEVLTGKIEVHSFFASLKDADRNEAIDFCRWIVSTYDYDKNPTILKAAFHRLAHYRDVASLEKLEKLGDTWKNTYMEEYEYLLALLKNASDGALCNCNVYCDATFNVPPYQDDLEITNSGSRKYDDYMITQLLYVRCIICGTNWEVEIDDSYHYPHSHWRKLSNHSISDIDVKR